ncbi:hypothetical protein AX16_008822 [Volvariella volvacea WC 439]|nr:hypothetical protein AX16_008822 [Volvariella volvacea WC 439]
MDSIRVSKVENVSCTKAGKTSGGTVHLTAHHLIFRYDGSAEEMWVPYPLISSVTRLPQSLQGQCPLTIYTRTFENFTLSFTKESEACDVFESVKELTVAISITQLYAFFYTPNPPFPTNNGWSIYSPREEFGRMGIGSRTKAWRFTDINKDYTFCPTYPAKLVVPTKISDTTLQYAAKYRSKARIPVLTYHHWANYGTITRSSQPMVGITQNRSIQDEKLIEAIFQSHHSPESRASITPIYGATSTNLIIDARPTKNAMANTVQGAGTENMDHYREGKKAYLGIDNIHTMRDSLNKVIEALREADALLASINNDLPERLSSLATLDRQALRRSGWLRHISAILEGSLLITKNVHINSSHVLIHCSDGWDRTSQLSSIAQLCLDPFYRTIRGFEILVEKDWLSYGHKFLDRSGHLSSEKFFVSAAEASGADAAQAFLASVQNRFASPHHVKETSPVFHQFLDAVRQIQRQFPARFEFNERFLRQLYYHLYSCQFGTFLFNSERERRAGDSGGSPLCERTVSVWDFLNSPSEMEKNTNSSYEPTLDEPTRRDSDMGVLLPNPKDVRFWFELFGRTDEEMNGRVGTLPVQKVDGVLTEGVEDDLSIQRSSTPASLPLPPSPKPSPLPAPSGLYSNALIDVPRSSSPALSAAPKELSASTPEVPPKPPQPVSESSASASMPSLQFSLANPLFSPSPSNAQTNARAWTKPPDFFASGGVKSMWGRFSSNASAAFSVVQEAYTGVTKDMRGSPGGDNTSTPRAAELRSRETLSSWGEEDTLRQASSQSRPTYTTTEPNPWALPHSRSPLPLDPYENPWGSGSTASADPPVDSDSLEPLPSRPLPIDPTIAQLASSNLVRAQTPNPPADQDRSGTKATDPLGVGL